MGLFQVPISQAAQNIQQCIELPQRTLPCPNLLYTSLKKDKVNRVICVCKTDKNLLLKLLVDDTVSSQRVSVFKLLNKHQLTKTEMQSIIEDISISYNL